MKQKPTFPRFPDALQRAIVATLARPGVDTHAILAQLQLPYALYVDGDNELAQHAYTMLQRILALERNAVPGIESALQSGDLGGAERDLDENE